MKLEKIKKILQGIKNKVMLCMIQIYMALIFSNAVYAFGDTAVQDSQLVKGTEKLISDVTTWFMVLSPIVAGLFIVYFSIRRSAADEMDQKKWNNRIVTAIVSCIGAVLASTTLNIIIGYYK